MPNIKITVRNKIAENTSRTEYVCGNSDFVIDFDFDEEWDAYETKTARFKWNGSYEEVVFSGNCCEVPIITNTVFFCVGVYAGNLHTTTAANVLCRRSILCGSEVKSEGGLLGSNEIIDAIKKQSEEQIQSVTQIVDSGYDDVMAAIKSMFGKTETVLCAVTANDFDENGMCLIPNDSIVQLGYETEFMARIAGKTTSVDWWLDVTTISDTTFVLHNETIVLCVGQNLMTGEAYEGFCVMTSERLEEGTSVQFVKVEWKKIPIEYVDTTDIENTVYTIANEVNRL